MREYGVEKPEWLHRCEICGRRFGGFFGESYMQCPICGRFVCVGGCWDGEKGMCKICSREMPDKSVVEELREEIMRIRKELRDIREKLDMIHLCPNCHALVVDPKARYCGICGAELHKKRSRVFRIVERM